MVVLACIKLRSRVFVNAQSSHIINGTTNLHTPVHCQNQTLRFVGQHVTWSQPTRQMSFPAGKSPNLLSWRNQEEIKPRMRRFIYWQMGAFKLKFHDSHYSTESEVGTHPKRPRKRWLNMGRLIPVWVRWRGWGGWGGIKDEKQILLIWHLLIKSTIMDEGQISFS